MGRNNADFEDGHQNFYHASWRENRESIEREGLKAQQPWDDQPTGVYVSKGPHVTKHYGDDIYEIRAPKTEPILEDDMEWGAHVIPRDIPVSDFKRVGHVFKTKDGSPQVHLHPEEECDGKELPW